MHCLIINDMRARLCWLWMEELEMGNLGIANS